MARAEVGGAAGVDERQAWETWLAEVSAVYRLAFLRAAAWGAWITAHAVALPAPCAALVTRGLTGGTSADPRRGFLARGQRPDGAPVVEWTDKGRQVRPDSITATGRGVAWIYAASGAAKAANSLRYGARGRDGREVAAGWSITGSVAPCYVSTDEAGELVEADRPAWGPVSGRPDQSAGVARRVGVEAAILSSLRALENVARDSLRAARIKAAKLRARADWMLARAAVLESSGRKRRAIVARKVARLRQAAAGSMIGGAVRGFRAAAEDSAMIGGALRGEPLPPEVFAAWIVGPGALAPAGWKKAERMREAVRDKLPFPYLATVHGRAMTPAAPAVMGDEVATDARPCYAFKSRGDWQAFRARHVAALPAPCKRLVALCVQPRAMAAA